VGIRFSDWLGVEALGAAVFSYGFSNMRGWVVSRRHVDMELESFVSCITQRSSFVTEHDWEELTLSCAI